ncbi:type II toxin-antitoxin system VapC family toxin [Candidatus Woesearchaeota archaeon]|nr:type II toxin-antitoxin system VapC family toxin [Candidatus Woesearchaeota archaeon]
MDGKLCLDTDFCIEIIKGNASIETLFDKFGPYEIYITSITMFELFLRETNIKIVENFVSSFFVIYFDDFSALKVSEISKDLKRKGISIDFRDLFIASICIVNNCNLATFNKKHFEHTKDLELV